MRIKFQFDLSAEERQTNQSIQSAIDRWWRTFLEKTGDLHALFKRQQDWDLPEWMEQNLGAISSNIMWEFGQGLLGGHRLVITPESRRHLRPLVAQILQRAPKIDGWEFYPYRLPEDEKMAGLTVDARQGARLDQMRFILSPGQFNRVDIRCIVPADYPEDKQKATGFVAIESLLGEEMLDRWIGYIDYEKAAPYPTEAVPPGDLLSAMRRLVQTLIMKLPNTSWIGRAEGSEWTSFKVNPKRGLADYPSRLDLLTQISAIPELHQCVFSGAVFDSDRFSKCGETFAYVKVDGDGGLPPWGFQDRAQIDDALSTALEGAGLGTVIGGGNGLRYCYTDLALLNVEAAVPVIRETLTRGGVSIRSWLLFFDDNFASEWVGVFPESPPPPMENLETES